MRQLRKAAARRYVRLRARGDEGFSIVELLVSIVVIGVLLVGMAGVQLKALETVTLSRQRQQAVDLTNRAMEQIRALPYDMIAAGLRTTDLAGDPNITSGRFRPTYDASIDEVLVTSAGAATLPLYPHVQSTAATRVGPIQFRISSYVTLVSGTAGNTTEGYWLTVIATWSSVHSKGVTKTVGTRSQLFSPSGCLSSATHPFSGPCQAFYDGASGDTPAGISIANETAGTLAFLGNPLLTGTVSAASLSSVVQAEQTVSAQSRSVTSGARYSTSTGETISGEVAAATGATTDPATGAATLPATATATQSSVSVDADGTDSRFTMTGGVSDSGSAASTNAATAATGCVNLANAAITSGQACSSSAVVPGGAMSATLAYGGKTIPLASIDASATPTRAFVARYLTSGGVYCPTASGLGCISANTSRAFGTARAGGLPNAVTGAPAGFSYMASVTGYSDAVRAEAGIGAVTPASASRAGTLTYWGGAGSDINLNLATAGAQTLPLAPVTYAYPSGVVTVRMTGDISITATGTASTGVAPCQPVACARSATGGSVVATVTYEIFSAAVLVGQFDVTVNLGSALANTSYRAAPVV